MRKTEGRLTFEFKTALDVRQSERDADPLKCVDFVVEEESATWMIEVTDALRAPDEELLRAIADLSGQLTSGRLSKDMLMKLYGTHAYLASRTYRPAKQVYFAVIIDLPPHRLKTASRNAVRDEIDRVVRKIGPSFHGTGNTPIIEVESIESWNARHPDVQIS